LMSGGLQRVSGENMKKLLQFFSKNGFIAVCAGTFVTAVIQSSSATTVMVIGFINAGLLTLRQSIGIIFGANIGTTITAQIISFKLDGLALPAIAAGFLVMLSKKRVIKGWGETLFGFGLIFFGMNMMSSQLTVLGKFPTFAAVFQTFNCAPAPGSLMPFGAVMGAIAIGLVATGIIQSSSASTGIVIALAGGGLINFFTAIPLLIGCNIGTTITAGFAALTANRHAKQAALAHFLFNTIGALVMLVLLYIPYGAARTPIFLYMVNAITPGNVFAAIPENVTRHIAMAHTLFNVLTVLLLCPFMKHFALLCEKLLPVTDEAGLKTITLEPHLLATPSIALEQSISAIRNMVNISWNMIDLAVNRHFLKVNTSPEEFKELEESEQIIDDMQTDITNYLVQITRQRLTQVQSNLIPILMHCVNDAERIADHTENIMKLTKRLSKANIVLSEIAHHDMGKIWELLQSQAENVKLSLSGKNLESAALALEEERQINKLAKKYEKNYTRKEDYEALGSVNPSSGQRQAEDLLSEKAMENEEEINKLTKAYEESHIERRNTGKCAVDASVIFIEMLWELERIGDHLANIAARAPEIQKHYVEL
ncbi:MAG: Na/Pi cotransporter family protein, partial [Lentisphaeria bacterium]|nr:Na/Pi cotransporter family protein [Lentisphaeria bacterium]